MLFLIQLSGVLSVAASVLLAAKLLPGVRFRRRGTAFAVALAYGWLFTMFFSAVFMASVILVADQPQAERGGAIFFSLVMLPTASFAAHALLFWLAPKVVPGFEVHSALTVAGAAGIVTVVSALLYFSSVWLISKGS